MMSRAELLQILLKNVHYGHPFPKDILSKVPSLTANRQLDSILKLQMLIYNLALEKHFPSNGGSIFILGELVSCVASFVEMPQPPKKLASLDRIGFIKYCEDNRQFGQMASKAVGIYPRLPLNNHLPRIMNYEADSGKEQQERMKYVGNPNWQLTRSILAEWHDCVKGTLSAEENLSCHILLSTDSLLSLCQESCWNRLWSRLYVWYMDRLLTSNLNPSIASKNWHHISEEEKHIKSIEDTCYSRESTAYQDIIKKLIMAVIKEFICFDKEDCHFKESFDIFTGRQNTGGDLWECLLINELFFKLAQLLELEVVAEKSRDLRATFKKQLEQGQIAEQFMYYLPQLFTRQELIAYLRKNHVAFWQYKFDDNLIETITLRQIQEGTLHHVNAKQVLKLLTPKQFLTQVLSQDYSLWEGRKEKSFNEKKKLKLIVKTVTQHAEELAAKLAKHLKESKKQIVKALNVFAQQWSCVQQVQEDGVREETLGGVLQLIKFDTKLPQTFKNQCRLPIEENELVWQMIDRLVDFMTSDFDALPPETVASIKQTFYTKQFYLTLRRLPTSRKDIFWQRFSWILLKDTSFVKALLAIKPNHGTPERDVSMGSGRGAEEEADIVTS